MRKLFFIGVLLVVSMFYSTSALLAKDDGTGECDAVYLEQVLKQARGITASTAFLSELKPEFDDTKNFVESMVAEQNREWAENSRKQEESFAQGKKEYEAALNRYWGKNSQPKLKND